MVNGTKYYLIRPEKRVIIVFCVLTTNLRTQKDFRLLGKASGNPSALARCATGKSYRKVIFFLVVYSSPLCWIFLKGSQILARKRYVNRFDLVG